MHEAFVADHALRAKLGWFFALAVPLVAISHFYTFASHEGTYSTLSLLTGIAQSWAAIIAIWGVLHLKRPVVELFDDRLEAMLVYQFFGRKRIPYDEIAGVSLSGYRLRIEKRSGAVVKIRLGSLAPDTRRRVAAAIEARIGARS